MEADGHTIHFHKPQQKFPRDGQKQQEVRNSSAKEDHFLHLLRSATKQLVKNHTVGDGAVETCGGTKNRPRWQVKLSSIRKASYADKKRLNNELPEEDAVCAFGLFSVDSLKLKMCLCRWGIKCIC